MKRWMMRDIKLVKCEHRTKRMLKVMKIIEICQTNIFNNIHVLNQEIK